MKTIAAIGGVALALAGLWYLGNPQPPQPAGSWLPAATPPPKNPKSNVIATPFARTKLASSLIASSQQPPVQVQIVSPPAHPQPPALPGQLPPGIYRTLPYAGIVVVPGPHPDDRMIVSIAGEACPMPIIRPDLQFIPLSSANK